MVVIDEDEEVELTPVAASVAYVTVFITEFGRDWKANLKRMTSLEWPSMFPELELQADYNSFDFMEAHLGRVLTILKQEDPDSSKYCFLPYMVTHSRGSSPSRSQAMRAVHRTSPPLIDRTLSSALGVCSLMAFAKAISSLPLLVNIWASS
jgi:hypothetical protein